MHIQEESLWSGIPYRATCRRSRRLVSTAIALACSDLVAILAAGAVSVLVRHWLGGEFELSFYLRLSPFALLFLCAYWLLDLYPGIALHPAVELQRILRGTTLTVLAFGAATFFQRDADLYSRSILIVTWVLACIGAFVLRRISRRWFSRFGWWGERCIVVGSGAALQRLVLELGKEQHSGLRVCRIIDIGLGGDVTASFTSGGDTRYSESISAVAERNGAHYAIVVASGLTGTCLAQLVESDLGGLKNVIVVPDLLGIGSLNVHTHDFGGVLGVKVEHRLLSSVSRRLKRMFDLLLSTLLLFLLLPVFLLLFLAIRLTSKGGAFYRQERIGEKGRSFPALKFRSMCSNSSEVLAEFLNRNSEARLEWTQDQKLKQDPRITWIGKFLRRTSLDELPQLWNVLRGEMSLVGPRPIVSTEIMKYGDQFELYKRVQPGITGLWQVSGRNNTSYEERVKLDEYYVRNWSVWLDLYILAKTVRVVLTAEGAY